jgi:2,3-bisphosphoglycerate-independent phosphoglycerate mutase
MSKTILIIMDGWGIGKIPHVDAIKNAHTPFVDSLYNKYPNSTLITCGTDVGLPNGQMGNSEVGHLNLGAGRIVYQELERINVAVRTKTLEINLQLLAAIKYAKDNRVALHLMGLVSDGGVHSHIEHLKALCDICKVHQLKQVFIHAFTDGRDTDPKGGAKYLKELQQHLNNSVGIIASITGRYYAMDRDKRWERVAIAYNALVHGKGHLTHNPLAALDDSYEKGITDEFLMPIITTDASNQPVGVIQPNDAVLCFNFRTDRCREITAVLTQQDFPELGMHTLPLYYSTMTEYDKTFKNVKVLFNNDDLKNTLGEVISQHGKTQLRIAETEKYPHVTFFFSGGRENNFDGEDRIVVPSPKEVATYDLKPEMSANELTTQVVNAINKSTPDFICLNYANADMVGHTGVWKAAIKAAETVDACVQKVVVAALQKDYTILLTADHGNSDLLINEDGSPNTAHTLNPVPLFLISNHPNIYELQSGKLGDIAPTILRIMELPIPSEMTGDILIRKA